MQIEELSLDNFETALQLVMEMWPDSDLEDEHANCLNILKVDHQMMYLGKVEEEYVGYIWLAMRSDYVEGTTTSPVAYMEGIFVRPQFQQKGFGRLLVETGEKWGKEKGASEYASDTDLTNIDSIAFHQKVGFRIADQIVCFVKKINKD